MNINDDSYPIELDIPADPMDPRRGDVLDSWRPTAAETAVAAELLHAYVSRDRDAHFMFRDVCADAIECGRVPQLALALIEHFATTAVGAQGESLTVRRLESDLDTARADALRKAIQYGEPWTAAEQ